MAFSKQLTRTTVAAISLIVGALAGGAGLRTLSATPQFAVPNAADLRFRLVGDEPVAGPDGQSIVTGWKVLVFKDLKANQCYFTFTHGDSVGVTGATACPVAK